MSALIHDARRAHELTVEIEAVRLRQEARDARDWPLADAIRRELAAGNVELRDQPDGTEWLITPQAPLADELAKTKRAGVAPGPSSRQIPPTAPPPGPVRALPPFAGSEPPL